MINVTAARPSPLQGLHFLSLMVHDLEACNHFYHKILGLKIHKHAKDEYAYLTSGTDLLSLHKAPADTDFSKHQRVDYFGFLVQSAEEVDNWYDYLRDHKIKLIGVPQPIANDGRYFYCEDPDGNKLQFLYLPTLIITEQTDDE